MVYNPTGRVCHITKEVFTEFSLNIFAKFVKDLKYLQRLWLKYIPNADSHKLHLSQTAFSTKPCYRFSSPVSLSQFSSFCHHHNSLCCYLFNHSLKNRVTLHNTKYWVSDIQMIN